MAYFNKEFVSRIVALEDSMIFINTEYGITEPASSYYFYTDLHNQHYTIVPLFVKNAFRNVAMVFVYSFHLVVLLMAKLYEVFTFIGVNTFERFVDTTVYGFQSALKPVYQYLQTTFLFKLTFLDKFVIGAVAVYFLAKLMVSILKNTGKKNEELMERIDELEKQIYVLKKQDRNREEDIEILFERQPNIRELENKLKKINTRVNELKKLM